MARIGVSGASGQLGRSVLKELASRRGKDDIIAISRTPATVQAPAIARHGDYDQPQTLVAAYQGLDSLLLIPSADLRPGVRGQQFVAAIDAAVKARVGHIVLMSVAGTYEVAEPSMYAAYWTGEQHLIKTAPRWTILRMNFYAESVADADGMALPAGFITGLGEERVSYVSREDVAAAAAGILLGKGDAGAIYDATGPAAITGVERAALLTEATGKPIRFEVTTDQVLRAGLAQANLPGDVINALVDIKSRMVSGGFDVVTGDVERLSGRRPRALRDVFKAKLS